MNEIVIIGAEGSIDVELVLKKLHSFCSPCQIFDATIICGKEHIISAYKHAKRAFMQGKNISNGLEMEILLYVAGKRQINDAVKFAGAKNNGKYVFLFIGKKEKEAREFIKNLGLKINRNLIKPTIKKLKKFGITEKELKTVDKSMRSDLVLEKIAMLDLIK
ncbi:MAG: hypothetical protein J7J36_04975 [Thermoplasmata archaeon]|nr:hypothetical protein [Thermoplasmata archaeon]